ncbi:MAG: cobalt-precorrin-6A reductase [Alphaproteobacteria bacterium]|nr:cobalt-precorrin-6A reductase [Alphaproteobacteria bacterium]
MPAPDLKILILGGTQEAVALASVLAAQRPDVSAVTSLAGRTQSPAPIPGPVRTGGFGGAARMRDYLRAEEFSALVDATHPFATQISSHAAQACTELGLPRLVLHRAPWRAAPDDQWHDVPDMPAAATYLPKLGRRVFLSTGPRAVAAFSAVTGVWFLVRMVDTPTTPLPFACGEIVLGRGPFDEAAERALMVEHRIDLLVTRNSGGAGAAAKLKAARDLDLPVIMVARPDPPPGVRVETVDAVLDWLAGQPSRNTCV